MKLYLQFGYGMMELSKILTSKWADDTAIVLSPRDLNYHQLLNFGKKLLKQGTEALIDPQLYDPAQTNLPQFAEHDYWPANETFPTGKNFAVCLKHLVTLNTEVGCTRIIIPGLLAISINPHWIKLQEQTINYVNNSELDGLSPIFTIALGPDALKNNNEVQDLLEALEDWEINSVYLVLKHPDGEYLIDSGLWLTNALDIIAAMRLKGINVIVGYCSHQKLIMAASGANAICSGTWLNVRAFCIDKFSQPDSQARRSTWYYAPHLLSEFKIDALDVAQKLGKLKTLQTPTEYGSAYADPLFSGPQPSLAKMEFKEPVPFKHYLQCLKVQTINSSQATYKETIERLHNDLDYAEQELQQLKKVGITGKQRSLLDYISDSKAALYTLDAQRGSLLNRHWAKLI